MDYRGRVVAIYEQYAPAKLGSVDAQLEKYRGQEEALIAALVNKYGPEPSVAGDTMQDYRSRVVAIYEQYAPAKLGSVDAQLEKYRGQEEALITALVNKYVSGAASRASNSMASGHWSANDSMILENGRQREFMLAVSSFFDSEANCRLRIVLECSAAILDFCIDFEFLTRHFILQHECVAFVLILEGFFRTSLLLNELLSRPVVKHPLFPFVSENADILACFFSALGTVDVNGELFIDATTFRILFFHAIGSKSGDILHEELVSFNRFRQLLTLACRSEADVVARMRVFMSIEKRHLKVKQFTAAKELCAGFWAYKCCKPCVAEEWKRVWVVLEDNERLLLHLPNVMKPDLTIAVSRVLKCGLLSMLASQAPRVCAKNGLYLQLSLGKNPLMLLLCPQHVKHAHALVKFFRENIKNESNTNVSRRVLAISAGTTREDDESARENRNASGTAVFRTSASTCATRVWCCRGGCTKIVCSFWNVVGDQIEHHTEGKKARSFWSLATVKDVYVTNELAVKFPFSGPKFFFVVIYDKGTLFCCTETLASREKLVADMKSVMFKLFLRGGQAISTTCTTPVNIEPFF